MDLHIHWYTTHHFYELIKKSASTGKTFTRLTIGLFRGAPLFSSDSQVSNNTRATCEKQVVARRALVQLPDLSSVWSVPSLCCPRRSASPCTLSRMRALLWGSWWGSSRTYLPSFPESRVNRPWVRARWENFRKQAGRSGEVTPVCIRADGSSISAADSLSTTLHWSHPGLWCDHQGWDTNTFTINQVFRHWLCV